MKQLKELCTLGHQWIEVSHGNGRWGGVPERTRRSQTVALEIPAGAATGDDKGEGSTLPLGGGGDHWQ